jgi:hypothetical protein
MITVNHHCQSAIGVGNLFVLADHIHDVRVFGGPVIS